MTRWTSPALGLLALALVLTPSIAAQDETAAEKVSALQKEFEASNREWLQKYREAAKSGNREELLEIRRSQPLPRTWIPKFEEIIAADPTTDGAADAAIWIVSRGRATGRQLYNAVGVLQKHHSDNADLAKVCAALGRQPSPIVVKFLKHLEAKSPHADVRGQACFNLAMSYGYQSGLVQSLKSADKERLAKMTSYLGNDVVEALLRADPKVLDKKSEECYVKVVESPEYAALKSYRGTLGKAAERNLFELRNLAIGKVAPEIVGEDVDGNPMKLSDYRGKVVVLDFWGDW